MKELIKFLEKEFPNGCSITTPQFERTEKLAFEWKPENRYEFDAIVNNAPFDILKDFGFRKWDTMNNIINENKAKPKSQKISIPFINKPEENFETDIGRGNAPIEKLSSDEDIILFPKEWYNIIPNEYMVTGLNGESFPFKRGKTDDDIRFGCLAYGIRKKIIK